MAAILLIVALACAVAAGLGKAAVWWSVGIALIAALVGPVEDRGWRPVVARYWRGRRYRDMAMLFVAGAVPYLGGCMAVFALVAALN